MSKYLLFLPLMLLLLRPIEIALSEHPWAQAWSKIDKQQQLIDQASGLRTPPEEDRRREATRQIGLVGYAGLGVLRVLDDASFWAALACVVASLRLMAVRAPTTADESGMGGWRVVLIGVGVIGLALYVHRMVLTGGTVWWPVAHWPPEGWRYYPRASIQVIEGVLKIGAFVGLCYACWKSFAVVKRMSRMAQFPVQAGSELLTTCLCTFPLVFFVLAVFKLVTTDIGFAAESPLLFGIKLVGQLVVCSLPLWALAVAAIKQWGASRSYALRLSKELLTVEVIENVN